MANKIKGITIQIGAETTQLTSALKDVNSIISKSNSELKDLNKALKLDPKNTELLAQKQEVLKTNIAASTERLNQLKEAQRQMGDYSKLTDEQKESYRALSVEITKSEDAIKKMNTELKNTSKVDLSKMKDALKKVGEVAADVAKKMVEVTAKISAVVAGALTSVIGLGVKSYAELEKAQRGAERLFGDSFKIVEQNAANAYKSLGLGASQYYDQVNTYAVGLKAALNGDSEAAAKLSNDILVAQADIVAATGADAEAVSNAFSAVMRGNFTLIDNLRLGIKGSKEGMQEVIDKVNEWNAANGNATNYVMGNYADMQKALVDYTKMVGVAGTAQSQMSSTISGSVTQLKAAFDNFLNGSGSPEALSETIMNTLKNIAQAIKKLAPSILSGLVSLIKDLLPQVVSLIMELLPQLAQALTDLIDSLLEMVTNNQDKLQQTITDIINTIVLFFTENLPKVLEIAIQLVVTLAKGIAEAVPTLVPAIVECLVTMVQTLVENLPMIIDAAIELIMALAEALLDNLDIILMAIVDAIIGIIECLDEELPKIEDKMPELIEKIVQTLIKLIPKLLEAVIKIIEALLKFIVNSYSRWIEKGKEIIGNLAQGLKDAIPKVIDKIKELIGKIAEKIGELPGKALQWGKDMIQGFIDGIKNMIGKVGDAVGKVAEKVKNFLHFSRPDTGPLRDYETWMPDFVEGLAKGIRQSSHLLEDASLGLADDMSNSIIGSTSRALRGLNSGIQSSLNPSINPSVAYDLNYQLMACAMKEALDGMDVVMDDRQMGKFVKKTITEEVYS